MKNRSLLLLAGLFLIAIGCQKSGPQPADNAPKAERTEPAESQNTDLGAPPASAKSENSDVEAEQVGENQTDPKPDSGDESSEPNEESQADSPPKTTESGPMLPSPPDPSPDKPAADKPADDNADDATVNDPTVFIPEGPIAEQAARNAFLPPPGTTPLSKDGRLWIDAKRKRVYVDGYVALTHGPLEMFACPVGTKEHESIVAVLAKSREVHAALLAVEGTPGTPVRFRPEFSPPTGQVIRVWVCWYDSNNQFHAVDGRQWIEDLETEKAMDAEWVFAGSGFWQDPEDKREYYRADSGDMICVSNFSSAMLDVAISSSADADSLRFVPFESKIPDRSTSVRLVLVPVPNPTDSTDGPQESDVLDLPTARDVPQKK